MINWKVFSHSMFLKDGHFLLHVGVEGHVCTLSILCCLCTDSSTLNAIIKYAESWYLGVEGQIFCVEPVSWISDLSLFGVCSVDLQLNLHHSQK